MNSSQDKPRLISTRLRAEAERPSENPVRVKALLLEAAEALERHLLNRLEDELASSSQPRADSEAAQGVKDFLKVVDDVYPNGHPDIIITTGAATPLRLSHLRTLVESVASRAATETTHSETPRTLALNLRCGQDGLSWDQSGPKFHALAEQLERELAEEKARHEACRLLAQGWKEDAERAALSSAIPHNEIAAPQERPLNTNGGRETGHIGPQSECQSARGEAPRVPAAAASSTPPAIAPKDSAFRCYDSERWPGTGRCPQQCGSCATRYTPPTTAPTEIPILGSTYRLEKSSMGPWKVKYGDTFVRCLNQFEAGFVDSAIAACVRSATAITENDARYQWLRVRGCAIDGTEHQREGLVRRCINLDEEIDSLRAVDMDKANG